MCISSYKHSWIVVAGIIIKAYVSEDYDNYTVIKYIKLGLCLKHVGFLVYSIICFYWFPHNVV